MVETVHGGFCQHHRVVVAVAAQEGHHLGSVGQPKAENIAVERRQGFDVRCIDVHMRQPLHAVRHRIRGLAMIVVNEFEH